MRSSLPPRTRPLLAAALLVAALALGGAVGFWSGSSSHDILSYCEESLIDPSICSGNPNAKVKASYEAFRRDFQDQLEEAQASGSIARAGIFFRDLHNGPTIDLNASEGFAPMSLMKMPLMMAVLRYAQDHEGALDEKLRTPPAFATNVQVMDPERTLLPDTEYSVDELLRYMIAHSDNRALGLLSAWMDERAGRTAVVDTLIALGLMRQGDALPDAQITAKTYGSILRILYGAAYLSPEYSQKALEYLAQSTFKDGLAHDLPEGVRIAHKFGVHDDQAGAVQLHDCGIVYHPIGGPYILCVMTEGSDYDAQARYIREVARRFYELVGETPQE